MVAEGKRGSLTIFSPTLDIEQVPYNSFFVKFTLKSGYFAGDINNNKEDLIIWERTESIGGKKEIYFRNIISSLIDSTLGNPFSSQAINRRLLIRNILQFFFIFRAHDNYPVFWNGLGKRYITYFIVNIGDLVGKLFFGLKSIYIEYTSQWLLDKYKQKRQ